MFGNKYFGVRGKFGWYEQKTGLKYCWLVLQKSYLSLLQLETLVGI